MKPQNCKGTVPGLGYIFIACVIASLSVVTSAYLVDDNPYKHFVELDSKYQLEWLVDWNQRRVRFNATVKTTGYVGFGLTRQPGKMTGADIVIGGVYSNGKSYFSDRHAIGNQLPVVDSEQNWELHAAKERGGVTFLSFSRAFDTCDADHDIPITDDSLTLIWAYSEADDQIQYHFENRGSYNAYLLDPDLTPRSIEPEYENVHSNTDMQVFKISPTLHVPAQDTAYWCTIHRVPTTSKQHIVGFNTHFPTDLDRKHVHHLRLHRCKAPDGVDPVSLFEIPARSGGSQCYFFDKPNPLPIQYCRETIYSWAVGGRSFFFPEHAGMPMSETGTEYFVLQVHYDNPNSLPNLNITVELDAYYTSNIRRNEVGLYQLGEQIPAPVSIIVPPNSLDHVMIGHCAPGCTDRIVPDGGVSVFAVFLHTHYSGRAVRFLHHRGNQELAWISNDDNYNFNYQQTRILRQERRILPGDHLMQRCVFETTDRNGSVVTGGYSTSEEMCTSFVYYYPRSPGFGMCRSDIRTEAYYNFLGFQNTTWVESRRKMVITSPPQFAGLDIAEYANKYIDWNIENRDTIQRFHKFEPQVSVCPRVDRPPPNMPSLVEPPPQQLQRVSLSGRFAKIYGRTSALRNSESSVDNDPDPEHVSVYPRGIPRYRLPPQCTNDRSPSWGKMKSKQ